MPLTVPPPQQQGLKRDRDSHSSQESELSTLASAVVVGDDGDLSPPALNRQREEQPRFQPQHFQQQQQQQQLPPSSGGVGAALVSHGSSSSSSGTAPHLVHFPHH